MAVALDTVGTGGAIGTGSVFWGHTLGGSATALVVEVGSFAAPTNLGLTKYGFSSLVTHTVMVGSTPMNLLGIINNGNAIGNGWTELWGLINPPTGAQTISVAESVTGTTVTINGISTSYTGVSQFGTPVVNSGTSTALTSGAIASSTGNMVVSAQGVYNKTLSAPSGTSRYNQPTTASSTEVTLLVQDKAGASTVTQTSTASGSGPWGVVSVNLVAGSQWNVNASTALTTTPSATASFVGQVWHVNASLALTATRSAAGTGTVVGPPLRYVGRPPDSDSVIATAAYVTAKQNATLVTPTFINNQITIGAANLVTPAWISQQIANYVTQTQVVTALTAYVPDTALGAASGVAQLDGTEEIPPAQLPTLVTNSLAVNYDAATSGTIFLSSGTTATAGTTAIGEVQIAKVTIPNPGYPWVPMPFALVLGQAGGTPSGSRLSGNNNFGFLAVTPTGQNSPVYASGVCTDDTLPNYYLCLPFGGSGASAPISPTTQPPIIGSATLSLSGCCWSGNDYVFSGTGLIFFCLVLPAVGG